MYFHSCFKNMRLNRRVRAVFKFAIGVFFGVCLFNLIKYFIQPLVNSSKLKAFENFDNKLSIDLFHQVKIVCVVNTTPDNHKTKAIFIKKTWGKRCNKLLFITTQPDSEFDTIILPVNDSRTFLRKKMRKAFLHVYDNYANEFDWMLKTDDDK
jgi:hypothetical protein